MTLLAIAALVSLPVGGCGGTTRTVTVGDSETAGVQRNVAPWTEQDLIDALDLTVVDSGISYKTKSGCEAVVLLTSRSAVDTYSGAGDPVVASPDGTAGVKLIDDSPRCRAEYARGLASLRADR